MNPGQEKPQRIPLFPLEVVLFPGTPLPLHIFEPRYKMMIETCLAERREFGVVLARKNKIVEVGCTSEIIEVLRRFPDGRLDILTMGRSAVRMLELFQEQPYYEARVEYLEEEADALEPAREESLLDAYQKCHRLVHRQEPKPVDVQAMGSLAFGLAHDLPLELDFKQRLLEIRAEGERQSVLLARLREWIPQLGHAEQVKRKAGGNGHTPLGA